MCRACPESELSVPELIEFYCILDKRKCRGMMCNIRTFMSFVAEFII